MKDVRKAKKAHLHSQNGHASHFKLAKLLDRDAAWEKRKRLSIQATLSEEIAGSARLNLTLHPNPYYCHHLANYSPPFAKIDMDSPLPIEKIAASCVPNNVSTLQSHDKKREYVVLVLMGSFNPPTYMHLRMFELAKDALNSEGYIVLGGYMSPVNDAYGKRGLVSANHRIQMCELACESSSFVMVDPWEAKQSTYQRSLVVLNRIKSSISDGRLDVARDSLKVMLLCGSDLLESFTKPGVWISDQVRTICRDFGIVCIHREGKDIEKLIADDEILRENKDNIILVDELIPNQISSTRVRDCIRRALSVKYLTADVVIEYIKQHKLYID